MGQLSVSTTWLHGYIGSENTPCLHTHSGQQPVNILESQIKDTCFTLFRLVLLKLYSCWSPCHPQKTLLLSQDSEVNSTLETEVTCWLWAEWKLHSEIQWKRHFRSVCTMFFKWCNEASVKGKALKLYKGWSGAPCVLFGWLLLLFLVLMMENTVFL